MMSQKATNGIDDDAAFARSLQQVADEEYAKFESKRLRPRQKPSTRSRSETQPSTRNISQTSETMRSRSWIIRGIRVPKLFSFSSASRSQQQKISHSPPTEFADGSSDSKTNKRLLYVPCKINEHLVGILVDTGASTSVISEPLMKKLNLEHRLNTTRKGMAVGVGSARILGRIFDCPIQIGHAEFLLNFAVLESNNDKLILGVDQLRRFNCLVDLQSKKLIFGGKGGVEVNFFS